VYNGEAFLQEAIDSVLVQRFSDFELIIVDDGSTDRTAAIIAQCHDPRLRVIRRPHSGLVAALNAGLAAARGKWVARQDADDLCLPSRFEEQLATLTRDRDAVLSFAGVEIIGARPKHSRPSHLPRTRALQALKLCYQCPFTHSTVIFRRDLVLEVGCYDAADFPAEDFALWGRLIQRGGFSAIAKPLLKYRIHPGSISHRRETAQQEQKHLIAARHCRCLMGLDEGEAKRAYAVLATPPTQRTWSDWRWVLRRGVYRLPWRSPELVAWVLSQSLQMLGRRL
jgi:glycosyltransferase involved in cell wall biosynthesis